MTILSALEGSVPFARIQGGDVVQAHGRQSEEGDRHGHGVGGVLPAARAGARASHALEAAQIGRRHPPRRAGAHRLEHVHDGDVLALEPARHDRAPVQHQRGQIHARQRHHRPRDGLVAARQRDHAVAHRAQDCQLDRVGDDLARDQRGAHPLAAHRDPVGDHDGVELDRRAPRRADAFLHLVAQRAQVNVARRDVAPRVRERDERLVQVGVVQPGGLQHRARGRAADALLDGVAAHGARHDRPPSRLWQAAGLWARERASAGGRRGRAGRRRALWRRGRRRGSDGLLAGTALAAGLRRGRDAGDTGAVTPHEVVGRAVLEAIDAAPIGREQIVDGVRAVVAVPLLEGGADAGGATGRGGQQQGHDAHPGL